MKQHRYAFRIILPVLVVVLISVAASAPKTADQSVPPPATISRLIHQLDSPALQQRRDAARELANIEPMPPEVIDALAHFLLTAEQTDASQRYAIMGLAKAGSPAVPAVAQLLNSTYPRLARRQSKFWAGCRPRRLRPGRS